MHGEDDQIVPVKDSAKKSAKLIKGAVEIYYPGLPHGLTATHADLVNRDLIAFAHDYLVARARQDWTAEIEEMIADHHKITPSTADPDSLIEAFRRADWIDVTRGLRAFGIPRPFVRTPVRNMAQCRVSLASPDVDSRSVPKPSADAVAHGQAVMATRSGRGMCHTRNVLLSRETRRRR